MIAARPSASAASRRGLSRAAGHLPGGRGDGRPAFSFACGAAHLLLPGQGRAVPPAPSSSRRRGSDDQPKGRDHDLRADPGFPSAAFLLPGQRARQNLGLQGPACAGRNAAPASSRQAAAALGAQRQDRRADRAAQDLQGASPLTLSSGWEPGTRARRGLRVFFLLDCPGGAAAAGGFSPPSGQRPRGVALRAAGVDGGYRGLSQQALDLTAALVERQVRSKRGLSRPRARPTARGCSALFANFTTGGL